MLRVSLILCLMAGGVHSESQKAPEPEVKAMECDTCLARQNGKRALRDYLAEKRAKEEAEAKDDE
ncbi:MAG: hypothetical protein AAF829_14315 [Pseudomonadota bacterium]